MQKHVDVRDEAVQDERQRCIAIIRRVASDAAGNAEVIRFSPAAFAARVIAAIEAQAVSSSSVSRPSSPADQSVAVTLPPA